MMHSDGEADGLDYLGHLVADSSRFGLVLREVAPTTPVPTCPAWTADDLVWHLAEVQWFWGTVVREQVSGPEARKVKPRRPATGELLWDFYRRASDDLVEALAAASPDSPAWTWSNDQTVGFIRRRQAHEAFIHRVDAELTAGNRTPMDPQLSADGVDEALRVMYGTLPPWASFTASTVGSIRFSTSDTPRSWVASLGRLAGTDPADGRIYDEPCVQVEQGDDGVEVGATVEARAADIDCWLWHRPPMHPVTFSGDETLIGELKSMIAEGIS